MPTRLGYDIIDLIADWSLFFLLVVHTLHNLDHVPDFASIRARSDPPLDLQPIGNDTVPDTVHSGAVRSEIAHRTRNMGFRTGRRSQHSSHNHLLGRTWTPIIIYSQSEL